MKRTGRILPEAVKSVFQKPATVTYPAERGEVFDQVRGRLVFEADKCIGCKICMRDCPAKAIEIEKIADKQFKAILRMDRCIYCGQCAESCPKSALDCSSEFELAGLTHEDMKVDIGPAKKVSVEKGTDV